MEQNIPGLLPYILLNKQLGGVAPLVADPSFSVSRIRDFLEKSRQNRLPGLVNNLLSLPDIFMERILKGLDKCHTSNPPFKIYVRESFFGGNSFMLLKLVGSRPR